MIRYSDEIIENIKNSNDILDIVSQYVTLKRSGRNYLGLCPFHKEKTPSFSVSTDKQIFHCFGCHTGGNVIHFISKIENIGFKESLELLAEKSNILLPKSDKYVDMAKQNLREKIYKMNQETAIFYHQKLYESNQKIAQEYVKKRKLDNTTLKNFLIGVSGKFDELYKFLLNKGYTEEEMFAAGLIVKTEKGRYIDRYRNRLMFPILDVREKVIAFGGRVLDDSLPKYINSAENIVYSKGKNLFGLNVAKKDKLEKIIIVEGYMDAISLYKRGVKNVVASLGTALTEAQGRLLKKYSEKIIISYDSDAAGQAATLRGLEILSNLGMDVRILQLEDAKDPDEYVIKFGSGRFNLLAEKAISLVEFKVKVLKQSLNIENTSDKIKFLNEISKILSKVDNKIEREIYIEKLSQEYKISKEAIYAETNKLNYSQNSSKIMEKTSIKTMQPKEESSTLTDKREELVLSLLLSEKYQEVYEKIKTKILIEDFKNEINKKILKKLYEEIERGNSNNIINMFENEEEINKITRILLEQIDIAETDKCIQDLLNKINKEKLINKRNELLEKQNNTNLTKEEIESIDNELNEIIIQLSKSK